MRHTFVFLLGAGALAGNCHAGTDPVLEPVMAVIPAGTFMMGADGAAFQGSPDTRSRKPVHQVAIKEFRMARHEVTVGQFRQFAVATGHQPLNGQCWRPSSHAWGIEKVDGSWDAAPSAFHPVACVSWDDATAYAAWLSAQTGRRYRLPTEAEWEYVATAGGTETPISSRDPASLCRQENLSERRHKLAQARDFGIADNGKGAPCDDMAEYTTVVGMYAANRFGVHDMGGNVAEWVQDCQHADYEGAPADGSAWSTACDTSRGSMMVLRGGSFLSAPGAHRFTIRSQGLQTSTTGMDGFRLALDSGACKAGASCGSDPGQAFGAALARAQQAERERRRALPALGAGG